jgi:glutaredoxin
MSGVRRLTLYGRPDCHLCKDMAATLDELKGDLGFEYDVVDVDDDAALVERYGHLVPVLTLGDHTICHYFLDFPALRAWLASVEPSRS